jgi:hypothetical protein
MSDNNSLHPSGADECNTDPFAAIPLIDEARLERLRAMIPAASFGAIVQSYIDSDFFAGLAEGSPADDADFPGMVHDCKGTSANLGAARLRAIAEKLELACHNGDRDAIAVLLPELHRVTALTRQALASRVAGFVPPNPPGGEGRPQA